MIEELRDVGATIGFEVSRDHLLNVVDQTNFCRQQDKNAFIWESFPLPACSVCLQGGCFERMSQTSQHNNVDSDAVAANQNPTAGDSLESSDFIWNNNSDFELPLLQEAVAGGEEWEWLSHKQGYNHTMLSITVGHL